MARIMLITPNGGNETKTMDHIPRAGDKIPFRGAVCSIESVCWLPDEIEEEFKGLGLDVVIALK